MYRPVPSQVDLPAVEHEVLALWAERDVFARSLAASAGRPLWVFNEGPPTANGMPGAHHLEARVFKDVFPRYRTMKGFHVPRKAGWDCHGLPVELAVERELGFTTKGDIERYGVAEFNARCRESVLRHVDAFSEMTVRMGYWVDMDDAYWTMDADYIESVWWSLKKIFEAGLLVQDHRVTPYCPRCGTGLSDHELAQGYETVVDPSVYVRFPVAAGPLAQRFPGVALLVWTTTPWTLVSNTACAVNETVPYVVARTAAGEVLVIAAARREAVLGEDSEVLAELTGAELVGTAYTRPLSWLAFPETDGPLHTVLHADFVTADDGSGIAHEAPAFGADDLMLCRSHGLPVVNPLRADGTFEPDVPVVGGMFFKKADTAIVEELRTAGLLFRHVPYEHAYPHCWRCHTPLVYYAQPSWYIRTTAIKDQLLEQNAQTEWQPPTIQWGRYGDWLRGNIDWALSRNRYWGTPLPIWRNDLDPDRMVCVGSLAELGELAGKDLSGLDPHRPYVDDITFTVDGVDGVFRRVPEVIDGWYDSGSMPFAQFGYPYRGADLFEGRYPADFICEAIDQTRGWFYTLMVVGTLVFGQSSYRTVLCLGHILDEEGRKMSKHLGNVLEPIPLMDRHGADAVRWFMLAGGSPWQARRVGHGTIQEVVRKVLLTYWNTVSFQALYAGESDVDPAAVTLPVAERPALDRWALSEAHRLAREVDAAMDAYDTQRAGRLMSGYVDDLSNWYVRRSRRRFWHGDPAALATLHECLRIVTLLMAPFTPFITERVWQDLFVPSHGDAPESVHLAAWPEVDDDLVDDALAAQMALTRRLVELGRAARAASGVRTRQPLGRALVAAAGWDALPDELRREVAEELNVTDLVALGDAAGDLVDVTVKANFRSLGRRFGKRTQHVAAAVSAADPAELVSGLRAAGSVAVDADGEVVDLGADDLIVTESPREGWAVESAGGETVALDLTLTPELRRAGLAREVVRLVQEARKGAGLAVGDRIALWWHGDGEGADALREHATAIAGEVLATSYEQGSAPADAVRVDTGELDLVIALRKT